METFKNIVVGNVLGYVMVAGAAFGIVGGSFVICGAALVGLLLAGG
ncbi:hypothetical protein [Bdellovibrio sp. ArHS]|nr:hypothetical protein [Bdellovibrio sp. ArHS]